MSEFDATAQATLNKAFEATPEKPTDTLRPLLDQLMVGLHQAVERLNDVAAQAVEKVEQSGERLKDAQERVAGGARGYVREQPLTAVGVAVACGFLLSWALRRH